MSDLSPALFALQGERNGPMNGSENAQLWVHLDLLALSDASYRGSGFARI
jgi:hypothetical protein